MSVKRNLIGQERFESFENLIGVSLFIIYSNSGISRILLRTSIITYFKNDYLILKGTIVISIETKEINLISFLVY